MKHKPNILVVGTGAVGSFYGGKLAQAGAHVSTLCRSDYNIVKDTGISVKSCWDDFSYKPEQVILKSEQYNGKADYILVTLKALPTINIPEIIRNAVSLETTIVLIQNGIDIEDQLINAFPDNTIISGLAFICVSRIDFGKIDHMDYGRLVLGLYPEGEADKVQILTDLFIKSGVPCKISPNVITDRWKKLVWNTPFNSISVLGGGVDTKTILDNSKSSQLVHDIMEEVCKTAKASGHELPISIIKKNIDDTKKMKPYKTSMLLDYEAGKKMEVEAIIGNVIKIARQNNVPTPTLDTIHALMELQNSRK